MQSELSTLLHKKPQAGDEVIVEITNNHGKRVPVRAVVGQLVQERFWCQDLYPGNRDIYEVAIHDSYLALAGTTTSLVYSWHKDGQPHWHMTGM